MKRILIIEDDTQLQDIYLKKLTIENFEVFQAVDGTTGLMLVRTRQPHLVLLDIMLPGGLNGFDVLEMLKSDEVFKKIPVLILTNLDSEQNSARQIGAVEYLVKSNTPIDEVIIKIKKYIS